MVLSKRAAPLAVTIYDNSVRCYFRSTWVDALKRDEQNSARLTHAAMLSHWHGSRVHGDRIDQRKRLVIRYFVAFFFFFVFFFWGGGTTVC